MRVIADVKASGNVLIATTPYKLAIEDGKYEINIKPFEGLKTLAKTKCDDVGHS